MLMHFNLSSLLLHKRYQVIYKEVVEEVFRSFIEANQPVQKCKNKKHHKVKVMHSEITGVFSVKHTYIKSKSMHAVEKLPWWLMYYYICQVVITDVSIVAGFSEARFNL